MGEKSTPVKVFAAGECRAGWTSDIGKSAPCHRAIGQRVARTRAFVTRKNFALVTGLLDAIAATRSAGALAIHTAIRVSPQEHRRATNAKFPSHLLRRRTFRVR